MLPPRDRWVQLSEGVVWCLGFEASPGRVESGMARREGMAFWTVCLVFGGVVTLRVPRLPTDLEKRAGQRREEVVDEKEEHLCRVLSKPCRGDRKATTRPRREKGKEGGGMKGRERKGRDGTGGRNEDGALAARLDL